MSETTTTTQTACNDGRGTSTSNLAAQVDGSCPAINHTMQCLMSRDRDYIRRQRDLLRTILPREN